MTRAKPYDRDTALDAALSLFWAKGYHATSLKDLEGALAMKPGSIYAAFTNKETLYLAALERYFHQNRDAFRAMVQTAKSPLQALADHLRSYGDAPDEDTPCRACMLVKTILDIPTEDAPIAQRARTYLDDMKQEMSAAFAQAQSDGELAADADVDALALRYQADVTALRIEAHRGTELKAVLKLADAKAAELEELRV